MNFIIFLQTIVPTGMPTNIPESISINGYLPASPIVAIVLVVLAGIVIAKVVMRIIETLPG